MMNEKKPAFERRNEAQKPFEDRDLLEYFCEGLNRAIHAIRPSELIIIHWNAKEFIRGMGQACAGAHGLAHTQQNPAWLGIRDMIDKIQENFRRCIIAGREMPRKQMAEILEKVLYEGEKMGRAKSVGRQDVLAMLERRKAVHVVDGTENSQ